MLSLTANRQAFADLSFLPGQMVAVLLPLPFGGSYDYLVPAGWPALQAGDFVRVPLGGRQCEGVIWGAASGTVAPEKCRFIAELLPVPRLPVVSLQLIAWVAAYTLSPPGAVLKMAMSVPAALAGPRVSLLLRAAALAPPGLRLTEPRRRVLAEAHQPGSASDLARRASVSLSVVQGLLEAGALETVVMERKAANAEPDWQHPGPVLSEAQAGAATELRQRIGSGFSVTLLDGVTGSGKTEVYFEAVAEALAKGRQVLVLLPEIALSAQWLERFRHRFGALPMAWHSEVSDVARREGWRAVLEGRAKVVVGARSALFLPFADLGLIIIDEEHDGSYKQEEGVIYHARDMAVVRGRFGAIPVLLASATPSLETRTNVETGRYARVHLPDRHGGAQLPEILLVDQRRHPPARASWLSPPLLEALGQTLASREQALLFLNRRGYAPLTLCRKCGHRLQCTNCSTWLVLHRSAQAHGPGRLACHHCGHWRPMPEICPDCQAEGCFAACGPGVERLAEELTKHFAEARIAVMASDTLTGPGDAAALVARMEARDIDFLVGTQVVAKGHHFPFLTLVGVVDADLGLAGGDLRAAERTFQLLSQVAGRAGRAQHPGRVMLQTYQPEDKVMMALASGDAARFYAAETADRRMAGMPPFGKLAALVVSGADAAMVDEVARQLAKSAPNSGAVLVFGPAPAPLAFLRGKHRRRLLLKAPRQTSVQSLLRTWLRLVKVPSAVRVQVDVDPYSFL
ncbi:MAG TPA: primosomal protein N' [Rhodospirillaceae bacterium]|nr:primosomal protein N' [Rhodospirillaceae bacterium]